MSAELKIYLPYALTLLACIVAVVLWWKRRRDIDLLKNSHGSQIALYKQNAANMVKQLHSAKQALAGRVSADDGQANTLLEQQAKTFDKLKVKYDELQQAYSVLLNNSATPEDLDAAKQALAAKDRELEVLKRHQQDERSALEEALQVIERLQGNMAEKQAVSPVEATLTENMNEELLTTLQRQMQSQAYRLAQTVNERDDLQESLALSQAALQKLESEHAELQSRLQSLQNETAEPFEQLELLQKQITALTAEQCLWQEQAKGLVSKDALISEQEQHDMILADLRGDVECLQTERDELRAKLTELEIAAISPEKIVILEQQLRALAEQHSTLMDDYAHLEDQAIAQNVKTQQTELLLEDIQDLQRERDELQNRIDELTEDHEKLNLSFESVQKECDHVTQAFAAAKQQEKQWHQKLAALEIEKEEALLLHQKSQTNRDALVNAEMDQIRLALTTAQDEAVAATQRMEIEWQQMAAELQRLKDALKIAIAESTQYRCDLLETEERLVSARQESIQAKAEAETLLDQIARDALRSTDALSWMAAQKSVTSTSTASLAATVVPEAITQQYTAPLFKEPLSTSQHGAAVNTTRPAKLVGVYQTSAIVFVHERSSLLGSEFEKSILLPDDQKHNFGVSKQKLLSADGAKLLQASEHKHHVEPEKEEESHLTNHLLNAVTRAEERVAQRSESVRLYRKAFAHFYHCNGSLPSLECSVAADAALELSHMLHEDHEDASSMEAARAAADWVCRAYGQNSHPMAEAQRWLAQLLLEQGSVEDGIKAYQQTLAIREQTLGKTHPDAVAAREVLEMLSQQIAFAS
jgi:chromosome segregation ATPase